MPVLLRVFPQGLDSRDAQQAARLREAYEDWLERGLKQPSVHHAWVRHVLQEILGYPEGWLAEGQAIPPGIQAVMANVGEVLRPDLVLKRGDVGEKSILLVALYPPGQDLGKPISGKLWKATAGTRMMELLHGADLPLGLITNGEEWTLVSAPRGGTTGFASWYADLWMQEPLTLRAFHALLHLRRLVGVAEPDTLPALFIESSKDQQEVTDQLGYQVRQAVEVLVQAFDRIDAESGRSLLSDVGEAALYDSALTVMMRLVFLFSAEERGLLLLGDPLYDQNYAVSTLSALLREQAGQHGEELLERRHDAWCRLLSTFRAVYGGVEHEAMRLPPYGGTLFDPDRSPFLEGRARGTSWRASSANPLLINNRVVLHLLEALQVLRVKVPGGGPAEARRLSFRALDIEQIGHIYEGLLGHTAKRADEPVLGLSGLKDKEPEISLGVLEEIAQRGTVALVEFLRDKTGRSERALKRLIEEPPDIDEHALLMACGQDESIAGRVKRFAPFLRKDSFGQLVVVPSGSIYVTAGSDRRGTGTHYTARSLTEPIVKHTLCPLVYLGPAEGLPEAEWTLRTSNELLALKVCDMAMGSGAFLVESCRYLAERLAEAWEKTEREHPGCVIVTPEGELSTGIPTERLIPTDSAERVALARRYVADRCLYGVDINPMAVEMAKLSLWLITLQRDRPFGFLDHALKCGDALLGAGSIKQIENFSLRSGEDQITFATANLLRCVEEASDKRRVLEELPSNYHAQILAKSRLHAEAEAATEQVRAVADCLVAFELSGFDGEGYERQRARAAEQAEAAMRKGLPAFQAYAREQLRGRRTFHWPLEYPEAFSRGGFDAFVGNPPFMHGSWISSRFGDDYQEHLRRTAPGTSGKIDFVVFFLRRAASLVRDAGSVGLILTAKAKEGDARSSGFGTLIGNGYTIYHAWPERVWPGAASVLICFAAIRRGRWEGVCRIEDREVASIDSRLEAGKEEQAPFELASSKSRVFLGAKPDSLGFVLDPVEAELLRTNPANRRGIRGYFSGVDLNELVELEPPRFIIDFSGLSLEEAKTAPELLAIVETRVKPDRMKLKREAYRKRWWQFTEPQLTLFHAIRRRQRVLAVGRISKYFSFRFVNPECVFSDKIVVFDRDSWEDFAVLSSEIHNKWALRYGTTHGGGTPNYKPSECGATFPFPATLTGLESVGKRYHELRRQIMVMRQEGLTKIYNRFHDCSEESTDIERLRALQVEMDQAVATAYGWNSLELGHGFHSTKQGERYTLGESAQHSVLERLLTLNHRRYAEEATAGLQGKGARKAVSGRSGVGGAGASTLFG